MVLGVVSSHGASTCDAQDGNCTVPNLSRDQALLQLHGASTVAVRKSSLDAQCGAVRRRRRHQEMTTCRRRHSSAGHADTDQPWEQWKCNEQSNQMQCDPNAHVDNNIVGFPSSGRTKAAGLWCAVNIPPDNWALKSCPGTGSSTVKVLSYNLFWWNLFDRHGGGDRSAGKLIARTSGSEGYDFMGFQECDDRSRVLGDARVSGLAGDYATLNGGRGIAMAYLKTRWTLLAHGTEDVGEDSRDQYYGKRSAMWARLQNHEGKTVFFVNHHGPLKVSQGGGCTGSATALNIMRVIGDHAHNEDVIILVGDFNAGPHSSRIQELNRRLHRVHSGYAMGGVDHVFSNCPSGASGKTLGKGDGHRKSDHDALSATIRI